MFQLDSSIDKWKIKLVNSNSFTNSDIAELESHLLEEIDNLKDKELTEEEAFYIASSRLGSVELLSSEFTKINTKPIYLKRIMWLLAGYLLITFIQNVITTLSLLLTEGFYAIYDFNEKFFTSLPLIICVILSLIFLYILLNTKYQLLTKFQSWFSYMFSHNKLLLLIVFFIFIVMNSIGFTILRSFIVKISSIQHYGSMMYGNAIFIIIWTVLLCLIFITLTFKKSKN
ncbi:permease prefix domain 1-containing protein [Clostridium sp. DL1XJH146]